MAKKSGDTHLMAKPNSLDTGIKQCKNVLRYQIAAGSVDCLPALLDNRKTTLKTVSVFFIDHYFETQTNLVDKLCLSEVDQIFFVSTETEPTTEQINELTQQLLGSENTDIATIVGIGGGITLDTAKAVSNLLTNGGVAEDYQGWDLVREPGVYKIAVPTISGTGAEATRTCVMTNKTSGLKLGMNSDFTVYDELIMDPDLSRTVPRPQYFYTGMDAFIHCMESLSGFYRNPIGDAFSHQAMQLCEEVFLQGDMMNDSNRSKLMVASYLGGCAIATSYVGVVHPFSSCLSVVLVLHHCLANCITMRAMEEFYPEYFAAFWTMAEEQDIKVPRRVCKDLSDDQHRRLYESTIVHDKPLTNALGENFMEILTAEKVREMFEKM